MTKNEMDDFEAAKNISDVLSGFEKQRQERILRWVGERFSINIGSAPSAVQKFSDPAGAPQVPPSPLVDAGASLPVTDIRTFVRSKNPTSDNQTATVIAYYYRFAAPDNEKRETINSEILTNSIRMIGGAQPTRPGQTLTNAKNQGYLDLVGTGEYRINSVGENLVTMTLGANGGAEATVVKRRRPAGKKVAKKAAKAAKANPKKK